MAEAERLWAWEQGDSMPHRTAHDVRGDADPCVARRGRCDRAWPDVCTPGGAMKHTARTLCGLSSALLVACIATVPGPYDTQRCYWTWVADGYGGYEQLQCWSAPVGRFHPFVHRGGPVYRYPVGYAGPRVVVSVPRVGLVPAPPGAAVAPRVAVPVPAR